MWINCVTKKNNPSLINLGQAKENPQRFVYIFNSITLLHGYQYQLSFHLSHSLGKLLSLIFVCY